MPEPEIADTSPAVQNVEPGTYFWCSCGRSQAQPFCDGSHKETGFTPLEVSISKPRAVAWCLCKRSGTKPFCDGTHKALAEG